MIRAVLRSPLRIVFLAAVVFRSVTGWLLSTRPTDVNVGDPGQWIDAGDRTLRGEWPYKDWTGIYGPLLYGWGASWYRLLGADWRAALQMLEIISPVACLLLAAATAQLMFRHPRWQAGFLLAVAVPGLDAFYWSPGIRIWAPVAALSWAAKPPKGRWSWLPFVCCGVTPLLSPDTGIPCVIASLFFAGSAGVKIASLFLPTCLLWFGWPGATVNWITRTTELAATVSWIWGTPFPGDAFPVRRAVFFMPFVAPLLIGLHLGWTLRRGSAKERAELLPDVAIWILTAGCLRSLLGRTDTAHLLFVLPPLLLLAFRFASRMRVSGAVAALAFVLPFLWLSTLEGPARRSADAWRHAEVPMAPLPGERISLPADFARHLKRVTEATVPLLRPGEPVLSLPGPLYAHLLRRTQSFPWAVPELMNGKPFNLPRVVIVDAALALPWDPYFLPSPGGPLTWSTPADEPITRDLRETLRRWYAVRSEVDGARIMVRRSSPLPARREREIASLTPSGRDIETIVAGNATALAANDPACDEIRTRIRFSYSPFISGLAKSYIRVTAVERSGRIHEMVQPLPPASLDLELRWPVPRLPLDRIIIEAGNPGSFNPRPVAGTVGPVRLIRLGE